MWLKKRLICGAIAVSLIFGTAGAVMPPIDSEYLLIVDDSLEDAAYDLAQLLGGTKVLSRQVVLVSDVDAEFGDGVNGLSESEMQAFADHLTSGDAPVCPRYIAILGTDSVVPGKTLWNPASVPVNDTPQLLHFGSHLASDMGYFVDAAGMPMVKVGRLPFETVAQVQSYEARLVQYYAASSQSYTLIDQFVGNIRSSSGALLDQHYGDWAHAASDDVIVPERIDTHLAADFSDSTARFAHFESVLQRGCGIVTAFGQTHSDDWTADWISRATINGGLPNSTLPVYFLMTCNAHASRKYSTYISHRSNGQRLLQTGGGIASVGFAHYVDSSTMDRANKELFNRLAAGDSELGAIMNRCARAVIADTPSGAVGAAGLTLFGDPALELRGWGEPSMSISIGFETYEPDCAGIVTANELGAAVKREIIPYSRLAPITGFGSVACRVHAEDIGTPAGEVEVILANNMNYYVATGDKLYYYLYVEDTAGAVYVRPYSPTGEPLSLTALGSDLRHTGHEAGLQGLNPGWNYVECDISELAGERIGELRIVMESGGVPFSGPDFRVIVDNIGVERLGSVSLFDIVDANSDEMPDGWWFNDLWGPHDAVDVEGSCGVGFSSGAMLRTEVDNSNGFYAIGRSVLTHGANESIRACVKLTSPDSSRAVLLMYDMNTGACVAAEAPMVTSEFVEYDLELTFGPGLPNGGRYEFLVALAKGGVLGRHVTVDEFRVVFDGGNEQLLTEPGVGERGGSVLGEFSAYPNPFNPSTVVRYESRSSGALTLGIYDVRGRFVATLYSGTISVSEVIVARWNGFDNEGLPAAGGVYFVRAEGAGREPQTRKILLLK